MPDSNGLESQEGGGRSSPYVVLEEASLMDTVRSLLEKGDIALHTEEWDRLAASVAAADVGPVFFEVGRFPSRNAAHALTQAGRRYEAGVTPPLVAVSERMFRSRTVTVVLDARVSVS